MFHTGYCDYNRFNPDYDKIDRPKGSGDYLLLYFMTPMKVQSGRETLITREGAFMLYTPGKPQIYQAVKRFKNSFIHFTCDDDDFLKTYDLPVNRIVYLPAPDAVNTFLQYIYVESVGKQEHYEKQIDKLMHLLFILFPDNYMLIRKNPLSPQISMNTLKKPELKSLPISIRIEAQKAWHP